MLPNSSPKPASAGPESIRTGHEVWIKGPDRKPIGLKLRRNLRALANGPLGIQFLCHISTANQV